MTQSVWIVLTRAEHDGYYPDEVRATKAFATREEAVKERERLNADRFRDPLHADTTVFEVALPHPE